jgi:hypothetical protein
MMRKKGITLCLGAIEAARRGREGLCAAVNFAATGVYKKMRPRSGAATDGDRWGA